jgi:hypothetical protein
LPRLVMAVGTGTEGGGVGAALYIAGGHAHGSPVGSVARPSSHLGDLSEVEEEVAVPLRWMMV